MEKVIFVDKKEIKHLCMISDDNYVIPTCVTIQSLIDSDSINKYVIHIIASALTEQTIRQFKMMENANVTIDIINVNAKERFQDYHKFDDNAICVASIASLFKFLIPEILNDLDKVLYIDGDLIIKSDINKLYETDIANYYAAVVIDSGSVYWKHEFTKKVQHYFNSGVMLLNLKKLREEKLPEKLCKVKQELNDSSLMDQNVFNIVFDEKIKLLPIRYNFLVVNLYRANDKWKIQDVNKTYGTNYRNKRDLYEDAAIIHYSSKDKPWKNLDGACSDLWLHAYLNTPVKHNLINKINDIESGISVIMPCYNTEQYVKEALDSIVEQTYKNIEIICIDDGSTDKTLQVLKKYAGEHKEIDIKIFAHANMRQGYERNFGIGKATKKYIYFMDSDDLLDKNCFELLYSYMEEISLDLLFFEGVSFYENKELEKTYPEYKFYYNRKNFYPKIYDGKNLYIKFREHGDLIVSPCLQIVRKNFLENNNLKLPEILLYEDNLYLLDILLNAKRVKCITNILFKRRVRANSTMTKQNYKERITALTLIVNQMLLRLGKYENEEKLYKTIVEHISRFLINLQKFYEQLSIDERCMLLNSFSDNQKIVLSIVNLLGRKNLIIDEKNHKIKELENEQVNLLKRLKYAYKVKDNLLVELSEVKNSNINIKNSRCIIEKSIEYYKKYGLIKTIRKIKEKLSN